MSTTGRAKIVYGDDPRQFIDLFLPRKAETPARLLVYIHGGAWVSESTSMFYDLASYVSSHANVAVALIEYRLSPDVWHPAHLHDVFGALSTLFDRKTAELYAYDVEATVLCGHSAGAHMALAVALDSHARQEEYDATPIRSIEPLDVSICKRIKTFILVEPIVSLVDMLHEYPSYIYFVRTAFYSPDYNDAKAPFDELAKAGAQAWSLRSPDLYYGTNGPDVHFVKSQEDELLSEQYARSSLALLRKKGIEPHTDLDTYTGKHGDLLHTQRFWSFLVDRCG